MVTVRDFTKNAIRPPSSIPSNLKQRDEFSPPQGQSVQSIPLYSPTYSPSWPGGLPRGKPMTCVLPASQAGVFRGARLSSLPTYAVCGENTDLSHEV